MTEAYPFRTCIVMRVETDPEASEGCSVVPCSRCQEPCWIEDDAPALPPECVECASGMDSLTDYLKKRLPGWEFEIRPPEAP